MNATKESERDMYDQRNQELQTLIIASSVMFAALTALLVQGTLPAGTSQKFKFAFGLSGGISFMFLFLCMVFCIETLKLASKFMRFRNSKIATLARICRSLFISSRPEFGLTSI
jgi:hypothetical protein